jgi:hypothetical protein
MKTPKKNTLRPILLVLAVAALSVAYPAKANLITNGGFETGDFTGWTAVGTEDVHGSVNSVSPHSGSFQALLINGSLSQSVATTPSASYTIDFWLASSNQPGSTNSFIATWGGSTILSLTNQSTFGYTLYTFTKTASTASTALTFDFTSSTGTWHLDDVSVNPAAAGVPDAGSTLPLLGFASLGLAALRRKLS